MSEKSEEKEAKATERVEAPKDTPTVHVTAPTVEGGEAVSIAQSPDTMNQPGALPGGEYREILERAQADAREAAARDQAEAKERRKTAESETSTSPFGGLAPDRSGKPKRFASHREEMEDIIKRGLSVQHGAKVYTRIDQLPSEAELAAGDLPAQRRALEGLLARREKLDSEIEKLEADIKAAESTEKESKSKK